MRIGVDLDNTLIRYDSLFHRVACEMGMIPTDTPRTKTDVKRAVMDRHDNDVWTELQGFVYGERLGGAEAYPGALDFFRACHERSIPVAVISHKSRLPAKGPQVDLREAALSWLEAQGWLDQSAGGLSLENVEFCETRREKVAAIIRRNCTDFIDDLPEVFAEPEFPSSVNQFLFDPDNHHNDWTGGQRCQDWPELTEQFFPA